MEQKQLTQFTFYDFYWNLMKQSDDAAAGRMAMNICTFMFTDKEVKGLSGKLENYYWRNILEVLSEDKEIELQGKKPKTLNKTMRHFTFLDIYFEAIQLLPEDAQRGQYIKAICEFMFEGTERKLKPPVQQHFELAKRRLTLSRTRKKVGSIGGKQERVKLTDDDIDELTYGGEYMASFKDFKKLHPNIINDLYKSDEHLLKSIDWGLLDIGLGNCPQYKNCKSLSELLVHYKEIVACA